MAFHLIQKSLFWNTTDKTLAELKLWNILEVVKDSLYIFTALGLNMVPREWFMALTGKALGSKQEHWVYIARAVIPNLFVDPPGPSYNLTQQEQPYLLITSYTCRKTVADSTLKCEKSS